MTTTSLPTFLQEQARLHRLERAKQRSENANDYASLDAQRDAEAFIERFYGSTDAYQQTKFQLGMTPEHARCFEYYGVILQPKQIEFAVLARQARSLDGPNEIGIGGAKGGAKTFGIFAVIALDDSMSFPGLVTLYLRLTQKAMKEQLEDVANVILRHVPGVEIQTERIRFANGSRIVIGGFKDDNQALTYQGIERDRLAIEEATQLSERTHKTLNTVRRSSKVFNGVPLRPVTYYSTNPLGIGHVYIKKRFIDNERKRERGDASFDPRHRFIFARVEDNKALNAEYVETLDELTDAEYRAYRLGDWDVSAGAYFETWNHNRHVIQPIDDVRWMTRLWCSMDIGLHHWNMTYLHGEDGDGVIYTLDELAHRKAHPQTIAPDIHAWLARYGITTRDLIIFTAGSDAFTTTSLSQYSVDDKYRDLGIFLSPAETGQGSRVAGAHELARRLGSVERHLPPTWFITTRCPRLIECLPYLQRDPHRPEDVLKVDTNARGEGGDDPYDAARYGLYIPGLSTIS